MLITSKEMNEFLRQDFFNALKELFIGAVIWQAHPLNKDHHYLRLSGMSTSFMQARALYEFFYSTSAKHKTPKDGNNAQARHFVPSWTPHDKKNLYSIYMKNDTPAQKRVFHLAYCRSKYSGGTAPDESDHLKEQVLMFAKDIQRLTKEFAAADKSGNFRDSIRFALIEATRVAQELADQYEIANPFIRT